MKCVLYTNRKNTAKYLKDVKVRNVEIIVVEDLTLDFSKWISISLNWENKRIHEVILNWNQIRELHPSADFMGLVVDAKKYNIRKRLCGISHDNLFQVFFRTPAKAKSSTKHELLHCLSDKLLKPDILHIEYLQKGKTLEDYEDYLFPPEADSLLPLVNRKLADFEAVMSKIDPIKIVCGYRSAEEQDKLYAQGRTTKGKIVTNAKGGESMHQYGIALDYCFADGYPPRGERWNRANKIAEILGFYSYGLSDNFDDGHIQLMLDYAEKDFRLGKVDYTRYN